MARYTQSLLDLLNEEDKLLTERDELGDKIVENLYIAEECRDKNKTKEAENCVEKLRAEKEQVESNLQDTKNQLKRYLLDLFYD